MKNQLHESLLKKLEVLDPKIQKLEEQYSTVGTPLSKKRILDKLQSLYQKRRETNFKIDGIVR